MENMTSEDVAPPSSTNVDLSDTLRFVLGTLVGIPLGAVALRIPTTAGKELWILLSGVAVLFGTVQYAYALVGFAFSMLCFGIIKLLPDIACPQGIIFFLGMGFLLAYRLVHLMIDNPPPKDMVTGAYIMILCYRLVSLGFEVRGAEINMSKTKEGQKAKAPAKTPSPSLIRYLSYVYSFPGMLTGPVLAYADFHQYLETNPVVMSSENYDVWKKRVVYFMQTAGVFVFATMAFPAPEMKRLVTGWLGLRNCIEMFIFLAFGCFRLRFKYYTIWMLAEQSFLVAGIGCGDQKESYDLERIKAIDPYEIEIGAMAQKNSIQHMIAHWNMSVQRWLVRCVYKRFPSKQLRSFALFTVTAYVHGLSPGFYLFFFNLAILDVLEKKSQHLFVYEGPKYLMVVVRYMIVFRAFEYIVVPFHIPTASLWECVLVWQTLGFSFHIVGAILIIALVVFPKNKKPKAE
eukprot:m.20557 g.20557  ORF g.20557 m.20557 type:complete len:459 (+) comp6876_c0_seq1:101-1477(+)